jgi:hypothetical protein
VRSTRLGGAEHQYWKEKVAAKFRECGYAVQKEYPIGEGKTVDLVARKDGKTIAIEIETGKSDAVANIRKCLGAGFSNVLSVAATAQVKDAIQRAVGEINGGSSFVRVVTGLDVLDGERSHFGESMT